MSAPTRFIDTSAWYAALDRSDRNHQAAQSRLAEDGVRVLSDHVLIETWHLAAHRLGWDVAEKFFDTIRRGTATVIPVADADVNTHGRLARRLRISNSPWPTERPSR